MARGYKEVTAELPAPMKGINMVSSPQNLDPLEAVDIQGYEFEEYGVIGTPLNSNDLGQVVSSKVALSAYIFQREGSSTQLIVHMSDGTLRYSTDFLTAAPATWTTIASSLSTTAPFSYVTYLDEVFMTNGVDDYRKWSGSAQTTYPAVAKMKYLAVWKDVIWGAGETANPHRVRSCDPGAGQTWAALSFVDIEKGVGPGITSIAPVVNELVVFKLLNTFGIYDPVEYTNRIVDRNKGSISHFSTVSHNGVLYFLSHIGICQYLGDAPSQIISDRIAPAFDDLRHYAAPTTTLRDYANEAKAYACSFENHIDFTIPQTIYGGEVQSVSFQVYPDYPEKPWLRSGFTGEVAVSVREKGKPQQQYEFISGKLFRRYDGNTVGGNCRWVSSWVDFKEPTSEKYLHTIITLIRGTTNMYLHRDYDDAQGALGENLTTGFLEQVGVSANNIIMSEWTTYADGYGKAFQIATDTGNTASTKSYLGSGGDSAAVPVYRFSSGISRVILRARVLTEGLR